MATYEPIMQGKWEGALRHVFPGDAKLEDISIIVLNSLFVVYENLDPGIRCNQFVVSARQRLEQARAEPDIQNRVASLVGLCHTFGEFSKVALMRNDWGLSITAQGCVNLVQEIGGLWNYVRLGLPFPDRPGKDPQ